jgi:hypothetical protein
MRGCLNITRCLAAASPTAVLTPAVASALQSLLSDTSHALARFDSLLVRPIPVPRHASDNACYPAPPATCTAFPSESWLRIADWPASGLCCAGDRSSFACLALHRNLLAPRLIRNLHRLVADIGGCRCRRRSFVDRLISELRILRERLHEEGERVQREIVEYASSNRAAMQSTKGIAASLSNWKSAPEGPSIDEGA